MPAYADQGEIPLSMMPLVMISNVGGKMGVFVLSKGWVSMQDQELLKKVNAAWEIAPKEPSLEDQQKFKYEKSFACHIFGYNGKKMIALNHQVCERYQDFLGHPSKYGYAACEVNTVDMRNTRN